MNHQWPLPALGMDLKEPAECKRGCCPLRAGQDYNSSDDAGNISVCYYKWWLMLWGSFLCLSWNALLSTWVKSCLRDMGSCHHFPHQGWHSLHFSAQIVRNPWDSRLPEDWDGPKHLSRGRCLRSGKFLKAEQKKPDILWAESFKKSVKTGRGWSRWRGATAAIYIFQHWRKKQIYEAPQPRFLWWNYFINGCDICNVSLFKFKYCCFYSYS